MQVINKGTGIAIDPPGRAGRTDKPPPGERKLYMCISGPTDAAVSRRWGALPGGGGPLAYGLACKAAALAGPPCLSPPPPVVVQVRKAKGEMRRLLEEETLRFGLQAAADKSAYGKFTVV